MITPTEYRRYAAEKSIVDIESLLEVISDKISQERETEEVLETLYDFLSMGVTKSEVPDKIDRNSNKTDLINRAYKVQIAWQKLGKSEPSELAGYCISILENEVQIL